MKPGILALVLTLGLWAQTPPPADPKPADAKPEATPAPPASPAAPETLTGWVDFGYRWITNSDGNLNVYRSSVNLGEGPKLFGANLSYRPVKNKLFDRLDIQASSWGGEPYTSARVDMTKQGVYKFDFNYRKIDYFNDLPTFANPLQSLGSPLSQDARDTSRRIFDMQFDLFPNAKFSPFLAWGRDAGSGPGLQAFVAPTDEFLSSTVFNDAQDVVRGGAHFKTARFSATLEVGGVRFHDDEQVSYNGPSQPGNLAQLTLGVNQFLTSDNQLYHSSGSSFFSQASVLWRPFDSMDVTGQFSFSQPSVNLAYTELSTGTLVRQDQLMAYTGQTGTASGNALRPHPSGNLSWLWRVYSRLRLVNSYYTDRFHVTSNALFTTNYTGVTGLFGSTLPSTLAFVNPDTSFLESVYNRYQGEAMFDVTSRIILRAGFRQEWADAIVTPGSLRVYGSPEYGRERHGTFLSGIDVKLRKDLTLTGEGEASVGGAVDYFRTGLPTKDLLKARLRYRPRPSLSFNGIYSWMNGSNADVNINDQVRVRQASGNLTFAPRDGKRISISLDYMKSVNDSSMNILLPPYFNPDVSLYVQSANTASAWLDLGLFRGAKLGLGGSLLRSDGSRPTNFYQPRALFSVPCGSHATWTAEWRYFGFHEDLYPIENFNYKMVAVGLRLKL